MAARQQRTNIIVIVGPTASGKSELAMRIAKRLNGEIIAADSRTIYKGMDIGTDKPTNGDRAQVPHHLLDVLEPDQQFTAAQFKKLANEAIEEIHKKGGLPIMVGGSGLYIDSVIFDFKFGLLDKSLRAKLEGMSVAELLNHAQKHNISLGGIEPTNKRHIVRAIERGGMVEQKLKLRPGCLVVGLNPPGDVLVARISSRIDKMMVEGFMNEAVDLSAKYGWYSQAGSIYSVVREYKSGVKSEQDVKDELIKKHKNLAKRQKTWFKRNPYINWFSDSRKAEQFILGILNT